MADTRKSSSDTLWLDTYHIAKLHTLWQAEELASGEFGDGSEKFIVVWASGQQVKVEAL